MHHPEVRRLHAEGNIGDFDDAMALVADLWKKVHQDCEFLEKEPIGDDAEQIPLPRVVYDLLWRRHSQRLSAGQKPRILNVYTDPEHPGHNLVEATEYFDCLVEFQVFGRTKNEAREWTKKLEVFLLGYTGYFKSKGIHEILFQEELRPEVEDKYRQDMPFRRLRYLFRIQRTQVARFVRLNEIDIEASVQHPSGIKERLSQEDDFLTYAKQTDFF